MPIPDKMQSQIKQFKEAIDITGIILSKFDGTNKAGFLLQLRTGANSHPVCRPWEKDSI